MEIREIKGSDAEKFALLTEEIEASSQYMLWEAGERKVDFEQQSKKIEAIKESENSTIFVGEQANELVGFLFAIGGNATRNKHSVYIIIGILRDYRGHGIGTKLFKELEVWAKDHNIHRLELTVVTENKAGLSLYKKQGFEIEGTKRDSLFIDGEYVDEYYMSKIL
ncbi:GCN5 family acetyltransferase [Pontibacillus chungwhensis BH030062]|uniref:GCN5 family acetyltransferase n=1 Tax=Pontibacillus chungwhensis BH030062 TaxID=1385513 RepID=A0A0A2VC75_9BACI|nr:GNAT family N-acetyltransferase [Pontibacillus chungwhensis]KGP91270.1 GCN5 family acetyltransferase [Pontibacillus chungwhensis BH030062]